jgi:hypothetical protein
VLLLLSVVLPLVPGVTFVICGVTSSQWCYFCYLWYYLLSKSNTID